MRPAGAHLAVRRSRARRPPLGRNQFPAGSLLEPHRIVPEAAALLLACGAGPLEQRHGARLVVTHAGAEAVEDPEADAALREPELAAAVVPNGRPRPVRLERAPFLQYATGLEARGGVPAGAAALDLRERARRTGRVRAEPAGADQELCLARRGRLAGERNATVRRAEIARALGELARALRRARLRRESRAGAAGADGAALLERRPRRLAIPTAVAEIRRALARVRDAGGAGPRVERERPRRARARLRRLPRARARARGTRAGDPSRTPPRARRRKLARRRPARRRWDRCRGRTRRRSAPGRPGPRSPRARRRARGRARAARIAATAGPGAPRVYRPSQAASAREKSELRAPLASRPGRGSRRRRGRAPAREHLGGSRAHRAIRIRSSTGRSARVEPLRGRRAVRGRGRPRGRTVRGSLASARASDGGPRRGRRRARRAPRARGRAARGARRRPRPRRAPAPPRGPSARQVSVRIGRSIAPRSASVFSRTPGSHAPASASAAPARGARRRVGRGEEGEG